MLLLLLMEGCFGCREEEGIGPVSAVVMGDRRREGGQSDGGGDKEEGPAVGVERGEPAYVRPYVGWEGRHGSVVGWMEGSVWSSIQCGC